MEAGKVRFNGERGLPDLAAVSALSRRLRMQDLLLSLLASADGIAKGLQKHQTGCFGVPASNLCCEMPHNGHGWVDAAVIGPWWWHHQLVQLAHGRCTTRVLVSTPASALCSPRKCQALVPMLPFIQVCQPLGQPVCLITTAVLPGGPHELLEHMSPHPSGHTKSLMREGLVHCLLHLAELPRLHMTFLSGHSAASRLVRAAVPALTVAGDLLLQFVWYSCSKAWSL